MGIFWMWRAMVSWMRWTLVRTFLLGSLVVFSMLRLLQLPLALVADVEIANFASINFLLTRITRGDTTVVTSVTIMSTGPLPYLETFKFMSFWACERTRRPLVSVQLLNLLVDVVLSLVMLMLDVLFRFQELLGNLALLPLHRRSLCLSLQLRPSGLSSLLQLHQVSIVLLK